MRDGGAGDVGLTGDRAAPPTLRRGSGPTTARPSPGSPPAPEPPSRPDVRPPSPPRHDRATRTNSASAPAAGYDQTSGPPARLGLLTTPSLAGGPDRVRCLAGVWSVQLAVASTEVGDSGGAPSPCPLRVFSRTALRAGRGKGDESVGGAPPTEPGLRKRAEEPNTGRCARSGGQRGRNPCKNQNPSRAGRGRGGLPPACTTGLLCHQRPCSIRLAVLTTHLRDT